MAQEHLRRVLLFDRHPDCESLLTDLRSEGFEVRWARSREDAVAAVENGQRPAAVVLGEDGTGEPPSFLDHLRRSRPQLPVVIVGDGGDSRTVVSALRAGACDYVERRRAESDLPQVLVELIDGRTDDGRTDDVRADDGRADDGRTDGAAGDGAGTDGAAAAATPAENAGPPSNEDLDFVIGSEAMRRVRKLVEQVADTDVTVLVTGESGTGKEVVSRALHRLSHRNEEGFIKVNCAALPDSLLESELFGYDRGAFTGAVRRKPGKFELADGGTIFLDEIGEIELGLQAKLLQVLQDNAFSRLGGDSEVQVDARVVASTNRDLETAVAEGEFRDDLFFRLNVVRIEVPPLRHRREEIPLLMEHFVELHEAQYGRSVGALSESVVDRLVQHDWPGNVRELENIVKRMVVLGDVEGVLAGLDEERSAKAARGLDVEALIDEEGRIPPLKEVSRLAALEVEGQLIARALERTDWNRRQAAELLNISYKALLYKIRDCGLTPP